MKNVNKEPKRQRTESDTEDVGRERCKMCGGTGYENMLVVMPSGDFPWCHRCHGTGSEPKRVRYE